MPRTRHFGLTYRKADGMLGNRQSVRLHYANTHLVRLTCGTIGVQLHGTIVVALYPDDTYSLHTGGYHTATTLRRINECSPAMVYQRKFVWYVAGPTQPVFREGIRVDSTGCAC